MPAAFPTPPPNDLSLSVPPPPFSPLSLAAPLAITAPGLPGVLGGPVLGVVVARPLSGEAAELGGTGG